MSEPTPLSVADLARAAGRELTLAQAQGLADYLCLLAKWRRSVNLVGPTDWQEVLTHLAADSWHVADFLRRLPLPEALRSLDLGAGAGLPGIPLRLFWQAGDYYLVEVRAKRVAFLRLALGRLGLSRTFVAEGRVEDLDPDLLPADLILSRAFRPWPELLDLAATLAAPGGVCLVMASGPPPEQARSRPPWTLAGTADYPAPGGLRRLWAFTLSRACPP